MTTLRTDPLLGIARLLLLFLMGVMIIGMAGIAIALPALGIFHNAVLAEMAAEGVPASMIWVFAGMMVAAAGIMALIFLFLRHMMNIVDSVAQGDPFIPDNARRLTSMAWLMLAIQLIAIPINALGVYISTVTEGLEAEASHGVELNGLVLVLVLFILARVFRKGAEMRDDLEGTV